MHYFRIKNLKVFTTKCTRLKLHVLLFKAITVLDTKPLNYELIGTLRDIAELFHARVSAISIIYVIIPSVHPRVSIKSFNSGANNKYLIKLITSVENLFPLKVRFIELHLKMFLIKNENIVKIIFEIHISLNRAALVHYPPWPEVRRI